MKTTKELKTEFNTTAARLGSRARLGGKKHKPELQEYLYTDAKGYEIVVKVDTNRFEQLISNYPELLEF